MEFIIYVVLFFIAIGAVIFIENKSANNGNIKHENVNATYISGIDELIGEYKCTLSTLDNSLLICIPKNKLKIELAYNKIVSVGDKIERTQNITTTTKSPVGRGLVGGALFGSTGAIVGGLSGLNSKTQTTTTKEDFLIINYKDKNNDTKTMIFKTYCPGLIKYINAKIGNNLENTTIKL